jgi:hypothetical protein
MIFFLSHLCHYFSLFTNIAAKKVCEERFFGFVKRKCLPANQGLNWAIQAAIALHNPTNSPAFGGRTDGSTLAKGDAV